MLRKKMFLALRNDSTSSMLDGISSVNFICFHTLRSTMERKMSCVLLMA